jgi:phenylpyruvate tautomerase PptA (4-oxalocrotonate tautomerase family)
MRINDPDEEAIVVRVIKRANEIAAEQREELARRIINALSDALDKSRRKAPGH